jgi:hypothetical protein
MIKKCRGCAKLLPANYNLQFCATCIGNMFAASPAYAQAPQPNMNSCRGCGAANPIVNIFCWKCHAAVFQKGGGTQMPPQTRYNSAPYSSGPVSVKCRIVWDVKIQAYKVSTPYSQAFVDLIKLAIPVGQRDWKPAERYWIVTEPYGDALKKVAETIWKLTGEVVMESKADAEAEEAKRRAEAATHVHKAPIASVLNEFLMLLPNDALVAAYRRAAMELHPDKQGGSPEKMAYLNTLWDRIKVEKGI